MGEAAPAARLVALARGALGLTPRCLRTATGAVNLATVAATADEHLHVAAGAQKEPGWRLGTAGGKWTRSAMSGILSPHSCPARCGARRWSDLAV